MGAERFFDDVARTLAEPMPRQLAVRVIASPVVGGGPAVLELLGAGELAGRR